MTCVKKFTDNLFTFLRSIRSARGCMELLNSQAHPVLSVFSYTVIIESYRILKHTDSQFFDIALIQGHTAEGNVTLAFIFVCGAGLATCVGSAFAWCTHLANPKALSIALGISAGVMLYVS